MLYAFTYQINFIKFTSCGDIKELFFNSIFSNKHEEDLVKICHPNTYLGNLGVTLALIKCQINHRNYMAMMGQPIGIVCHVTNFIHIPTGKSAVFTSKLFH